MDPFDLLTRGTSIRKQKPGTGHALKHLIPSAGAPVHPQFLAGSAGDNPGNESRGVKRKRSEKAVAAQKPSNDLYSFGSATGGKADALDESSAEDGEPTIEVRLELPLTAPPRRSEGECRRILRLHKLKVTLMKPEKKKRRSGLDGTDKSSRLVSLTPQPLETFDELRSRFSISRRVAENLAKQGYTVPTEIQLGSLPLLLGNDADRGLSELKGKKTKKRSISESHLDLLTVAPTGSGKTLAFLIPVVQKLLHFSQERRKSSEAAKQVDFVKAIILAPTHELADQIVGEARRLCAGTAVRATAMRKGMRIAQEEEEVEDGERSKENLVKADIIVSTPMVLLHALEANLEKKGDEDAQEEPEVKTLGSIQSLIFDEADVLLDPLFREQTLRVWHACVNPALRVSLWSATIGSSIEELTQKCIRDRRKRLGLPSKDHHIIRIIAGLKDSALPTVSHRLMYTASEQGKLLGMRQLLHPASADSGQTGPPVRPPFLVFTQTIERATALHSELRYDIPIEAGGSSRIAVLHSNLSDTARASVMAGFRRGEIWVLITTDLLSRGVDFKGVNAVVNYDIPNTAAAYVHRAGRTGRAGREGGVAVTLYTKEDIPYVKNIANVIAASEKARGAGPEARDSGLQKWLLEALPTVSKKTKQALMRGGVSIRRPGAGTGDATDGKLARRMRISTKSGYDRRLENRKKGAIAGSRNQVDPDPQAAEAGSADEWGGLDD